MTDKTVLIVGATSDIGAAVARLYAKNGWRLALTARDREKAEREADDLAARGPSRPEVHLLDVTRLEDVQSFLGRMSVVPDTVVCMVGDLGDQARAQVDIAYAERVMRANYSGPALLLGGLAERMSERGSGALVGVSSVAGDRGRASNYVYGSAKAGFTAFLSGLRHRLAGGAVRVITVKPGFVRTRMTAGMRLPPALTAEPDEVAAAIWRAAEGRGGEVIYVRWMWRFVMMIVRALPEPVFKRTKL